MMPLSVDSIASPSIDEKIVSTVLVSKLSAMPLKMPARGLPFLATPFRIFCDSFAELKILR